MFGQSALTAASEVVGAIAVTTVHVNVLDRRIVRLDFRVKSRPKREHKIGPIAHVSGPIQSSCPDRVELI
jgi:hypothetical protein